MFSAPFECAPLHLPGISWGPDDDKSFEIESSLFKAKCDYACAICEVKAGEGAVNAAATMVFLIQSPLFNFTETYFILAGLGGIDPKCGSHGSVVFPLNAIQISNQYEVDIRELPDNFCVGYFPLGADSPTAKPKYFYGTEKYKLNSKFRDSIVEDLRRTTWQLQDSDSARIYRALYGFHPANSAPSLLLGDVFTSDVQWHGARLGDAFAAYARNIADSEIVPCVTAREDNGALASLDRAARAGLLSWDKILIIRSGVQFDRPPPNQTGIYSSCYIPTRVPKIFQYGTWMMQ